MSLTILIIDDDSSVIALWTRNLVPHGFMVRSANTMAEGLAQNAALPMPEIIILDIQLPDSRGTDTLNQIPILKQINPNARVIIATGWATPEIEYQAMQLGADAFKAKQDMTGQVNLFRALQECMKRNQLIGKELAACQLELTEKVAEVLRLNPKTRPLNP